MVDVLLLLLLLVTSREVEVEKVSDDDAVLVGMKLVPDTLPLSDDEAGIE